MPRFRAGDKKPVGSGRAKGTPNKKSLLLHEVLDGLGVDVPQRLIRLLPNLPKERQATILLELMTYLYPKRKPIDLADVPSEQSAGLEHPIVWEIAGVKKYPEDLRKIMEEWMDR